MKKAISHILAGIIALAVGGSGMSLRAERSWLVSSPAQLSTAPDNNAATIGNLADNDVNTAWESNPSRTDANYIQVELNEPMHLASDEDLVIYVKRSNDSDGLHPTTFHAEGSADGINWYNHVVYIYFTYRGPGTEEYSARIHTPELETDGFKYLRFTVTANINKVLVPNSDARRMRLAEFNILRLKRTDDYSDMLIDRFRLKYDYLTGAGSAYTVLNTNGILYSGNRQGDAAGWGDPTGFDENGVWNRDTEYLKSIGVEMPSYTMLTSANDPDVTTGSRQPTHVTEHELYAVPGDMIALYPYYTLNSNGSYQEIWSHWYDYTTGGRLKDSNGNDLLDFLIDPSVVIRTENSGFLAGTSMLNKDLVYEINSVETFREFARRVNAGETTLNGYISAEFTIESTDNLLPSIGTEAHPYAGHFEGNDCWISNARFEGGSRVGVFGVITDGAVIRGVALGQTSSISGTDYVGIVGVYHSSDPNGSVLIENCIGDPAITATGRNAGGILGCNTGEGAVYIRNCAYLGRLNGGYESGMISGWTGINSRSIIENCYCVDRAGSCQGFDIVNNKPKTVYRGTATLYNVYTGIANSADGIYESSSVMYTADFTKRLGDAFYYYPDWGYSRVKKNSQHTLRWYGTVGTFFQPRDIYTSEGYQHNLEKEEYVIAADFSQDINVDNIRHGDNLVIEPVINFRHIFRIRDGKKFADENMADTQGNRAFVKKNMRYVSARADVPFQIRFDSPVPTRPTTRSKWYYKISETDYRRVCSMNIEVYNYDTGEKIENPGFYAGEEFTGQGSRYINGVTYSTCGNGEQYYRMLKFDNPTVGRYIVRLIGKDINDNVIKLADGSGNDLWIQEYRISFLPEQSASFVTEDDIKLDKYSTHRTEYLESVCGQPKAKIDYDEYRFLENSQQVANPDNYINTISEGSPSNKYYRWPVTWNQSNYSFGYQSRHDYNMYMVSNNSYNTPYHSAADHERYDRLYYDTGGREQGYFYYINAAADPGIMARLRLDNLCIGSTITVSAWTMELSPNTETCNLAFNFVAYKKDGTRVPLHTFISGYVNDDQVGKWMHVYYSFIPDLTDHEFDAAEVDHYELELDSNCKNSNGADYAIDDIRAYVVRPQLYATQTTLTCDASMTSDIRIETPFEVLLQTLGMVPASSAEQAETISMYYTFIDKALYDDLRDQGLSADETFARAQLHYRYNPDGDEDQTFGHLSFKTFFDANPTYTGKEKPGDPASGKLDEGNRRMIVFNTTPENDCMTVGREYIVALWLPSPLDANPTTNPGYNEFQIEDACSKRGEFRLQGAGLIKVDGQVYYNDDPIEVCENQSPVVQIDLYTTDDMTSPKITDAFVDWYAGPASELEEARSPQGKPLRDILEIFRINYTSSTTADVEPTRQLTQEDIDYLKSLTSTEDDRGPLLTLYQASYVFPPVESDGNDNFVNVTAIPIRYLLGDNIAICTEPTEIRITVRNHAPLMGNGFNEAISYPESLSDIPLRIGLSQLMAVSGPGAVAAKQLSMPLRKVHPATSGVTKFQMAENKAVTLVETNDPAYRSLSPDNSGLRNIGVLNSITADSNRHDNIVTMSFDDDMIFKEGYYYRLRFDYREDVDGITLPDNVDATAVCNGQLVFTLKIVPEFQKWTGAVNNNWNNDDNWSRVEAADILRTPDAADRFTVSDANDCTFSYAPLDFTKVIIGQASSDAVADYPLMFAENNTALTIGASTYLWTGNADDADAGLATENIIFDMASTTTNGGIECRPWYANTCDQIHFNAGARMHRQNCFSHYNRAWVDIETKPSRWYTLASPLQSVVAGDMYLPTASASQNTELFRDINFNTSEYDRFRPAVFQRSWNKAQAIVYELPGSSEFSRNVAVQTTWSNVYNDVAVDYSAGEGFSIKTDLSNTSLNNESVKFRLPKADNTYLYYDFSGSVQGNPTTINRTAPYRLNPTSFTTTISAAGQSQYFLIGNPFVTRLDMAEFIRENSSVIEPAYWILSGDAQAAAVWDDIEGAFFGTIADAPSVGVGQGFFVKSKSPASSLTVSFSDAMLYEGPHGAGNIQPLSRSGNNGDILLISAITDGTDRSSSVVRLSPSANTAFREGEDAATLINPELGIGATVYTAADNRALAVNTLPVIDNTEIGIIADSNTGVTIRFSGSLADRGYKLLDIAEATVSDIYDGFEYSVQGSVAGRLFIVSDNAMSATDGLTIRLTDRTVTVCSTRGPVSADVFNTVGIPLESHSNGNTSISFELPSGIYLVSGNDGQQRISRMIMVK